MLQQNSDLPFFIIQLNHKGHIIKNLYCNQSIFSHDIICNNFIDLVDNSSIAKAKQFFNDILALGALMEWELSFRIKDAIEIFNVTGFKTTDYIYVMIYARSNSSQMIYDELALINNEQLNSIRILRKQLNQMAAEYTQIRAELNAENEALRNELNALKEKLQLR